MEKKNPPSLRPPSPLEKKRQGLLSLQKSVEEMRKDIKKKREAKEREEAREDICFWMDNAIFPYLEGLASNGYNEDLLSGIKRLIKEEKNPFRAKDGWNRTQETQTALNRFLALPQTRVLQILAKPYIKAKMQWIHKEAEWIREAILKEEYPDFYEAIMETEGGKQWLDNLITDFFKMIKRLLR